MSVGDRDQREFSRVALSGTVSLDLPDGTTLVGQIMDLSMRGVGVRSVATPDVDTEGRVAMVYGDGPDPVVIRGTGRVARLSDEGFALELVEVDLEGYHHLQMLVLYHAEIPSLVEEEIESHVGLNRR